MKTTGITLKYIGLIALLLLAFTADLLVGSISLPLREVGAALIGKESEAVVQDILWNFRMPKALTALLCGSALAVAGLLMQTLFRNPLAGPYVLGISSGASLGVALLVLTAGLFPLPALLATGWGQVIAAIVGALLILLLVLGTSLRINDTVSLLIVGMMFGSLSGAMVNLLQSFSNPDALKIYVVWTMGSLSAVYWKQMQVMAPLILIGLLIAVLLIKKLNALLLGENYARGLGVSVFRLRLSIILATCLMAGAATAFTGPIAFIGVAVPHIIRGMFSTADHRIILPGSMLGGAALLLLCDILSQQPGSSTVLPVNSVSALVGAPVILWVILKNRHLQM